MNWINIHTETLRGEEFIGAEPIERATWISLLGWCCAQENYGTIEDCKSWGSRKWQQLCGVTKEEAGMESALYRFVGNDLVVNFYPAEQHAAVNAKRENGKKGGRPPKVKTSEPLKDKEDKPHGYPNGNHVGNLEITLKERKGKERKGKEESLTLPFESQEFKMSWEEWLLYLKQKRKKPTEITKTKQLNILSKLTEFDAIMTINKSITNGWQGIFPPKDNLELSKPKHLNYAKEL